MIHYYYYHYYHCYHYYDYYYYGGAPTETLRHVCEQASSGLHCGSQARRVREDAEQNVYIYIYIYIYVT